MKFKDMYTKKEYKKLLKKSEKGYDGDMRGVCLYIQGRSFFGLGNTEINKIYLFEDDEYIFRLEDELEEKLIIYKNGEVISRKEFNRLYNECWHKNRTIMKWFNFITMWL